MSKRILVVEDEPLIAMMLEDWLLDLGHEIAGVAATNEKALELVETCRPDAVLLDVKLGQQSSEPVAQDLVRRRIPFVVSTGLDAEETGARFGALATLSKPFDFDALKAALAKLDGL